MNPFERLRKAVEKYEVNYSIPEEENNENAGEEYQPAETPHQFAQTTAKNTQFRATLVEEQTDHIQQINQLSGKAERLAKALKLAQMEKQQLIEQICVAQKNNELLEDKLKEYSRSWGSHEQKERKYKQQIHRINSTVDMLGNQLNHERAAKKNLAQELNKTKEGLNLQKERARKQIEALSEKVAKMQEEIRERSSMLEYNITKNAEERKQHKIIIERSKAEFEEKYNFIQAQNQEYLQQIYQLKTEKGIMEHKMETVANNNRDLQYQNSRLKEENLSFSQEIEQLKQNIKDAANQLSNLVDENNQLRENLQIEKQNIKIKVVEVKDQTVQLELEMYKRQCKDLLQEKIIRGKLSVSSSDGERAFEPIYQIVQEQHR